MLFCYAQILQGVRMKIFTFWEPVENMPEYIKLCIDTWRKFLPEYEIIILDYKTLDKWLGKDYYDKILYKKFSLPKQADAIRCALLSKYGGIWMDADTIITSSKVRDLLKNSSDFTIVGKHIAFIVANTNSKILEKWQKGIFNNLREFKYCRKIYKLFCKKKYKLINRWDYLGNGILDKFLENATEKEFYSIDASQNSIFPEKVWNNDPEMKPRELYTDFYFNNSFSLDFLEKNCGMILLHNSWTPDEYKNMTQEKFLEQDITLAKILKKVME